MKSFPWLPKPYNRRKETQKRTNVYDLLVQIIRPEESSALVQKKAGLILNLSLEPVNSLFIREGRMHDNEWVKIKINKIVNS